MVGGAPITAVGSRLKAAWSVFGTMRSKWRGLSRSLRALSLLLVVTLVVTGWQQATLIRTQPVEIEQHSDGSFRLVTRRVAGVTRTEAAASFPKVVSIVAVDNDGTRHAGMRLAAATLRAEQSEPVPLKVVRHSFCYDLEMGHFSFSHGSLATEPAYYAKQVSINYGGPTMGPRPQESWIGRIWKFIHK